MVFDTLHFAIILFLVVGLLFPVAPILISSVIAPKTRGGDFLMPYECGMPPHDRAWGHFGMNYYIYALIFIAFDVDVLYLFPIAVHFKDAPGYLAFIELTYFLFFVLLAILYFRAKGVFDWPRRINVRDFDSKA